MPSGSVWFEGIAVKCTAAIFFLAVDYVVSIRKDPPWKQDSQKEVWNSVFWSSSSKAIRIRSPKTRIISIVIIQQKHESSVINYFQTRSLLSYFPNLHQSFHLLFYCHGSLLFGIDCLEKKNGATSLTITFDTVITIAENEKKRTKLANKCRKKMFTLNHDNS